MKLCYVDEAGDTGALPTATAPIQPVLIICAVVIDQGSLSRLTHDLIALKKRFFPKLLPPGRPYLAWMPRELKGSEIRKSICSADRNGRRQAIGLLDKTVDLLRGYDIKIFGRALIKEIGGTIDGNAVYTSSMQAICFTLQNFLSQTGDSAFIIADSRNFTLNTSVANSIFTKKLKQGGDDYPSILEVPVFGHSNNHAGLQLCDLLCSGLLFPMAIDAYCTSHVANLHVRPGYSILRARYGLRLAQLQHRYLEMGRKRGGITTDDKLGKHSGGRLFNS